jgi:hypothetical protein
MALAGSFVLCDRPPLSSWLAVRGRFSPPQEWPPQHCRPALVAAAPVFRPLEGRY